MILFCPECNCERSVKKVQKEETYEVKGEQINFVEEVFKCDVCGTTIYESDLDSKNLDRVYDIYRKKKGLMGPAEIKELRRKFGNLSQRGLSTLLNWSPATIARYETGAIPSSAHNEQLKRLTEDNKYLTKLFEEAKERLNSLDIRRLDKVVEKIESDSSAPCVLPAEESLLNIITITYSSFKDNLFNGNREFDIDKLVNMIIYFVTQNTGLVKSKLLKLLWYADFTCFNRFDISISGTVYCHNYYGPIPLKHEILMAYLQEIEAIDLKPYDGPYEGDLINSLIKFDDIIFSEDELDVLENVSERFRNSSAAEMSTISHNEEGYQKTNLHQVIPYEYAKLLKALN
jgi:putative zinc finger/helix-turn-helix protein, YgiT family